MAKDSDLSADRQVQLSPSGTMALKAGTDFNILAASSQAGTLQLRAGNDINNIGNTLSAKDSLDLSAGRDINLRTTTTSVSLGTTRSGTDSTTLDKVAGLSVTDTGAGSSLLVSAGRDINLAAADISNAGVGGSTALSALRDLNLGTVGISARDDTVKNANNYRKESSTSEVGTVINGAGSVLLDAGNNLTVRAGQVDAGSGLSVNAGNNIDITTGSATYSLDQSSQTSKSGFLSKKVTTTRDTVDAVTSIASSLTGGTVSMKAGNDLNITDSAVVGDDAVKMAAGKEINIAAAIDTNSEWNHVEQKQSGLLRGGGGFGISYGTRTTTTDKTRDAVTQSGQARSLVGSIGGDLTLDAGNAIKVSGTDMSAGRDMGLAAKDVTIDAGKDKIDTRFKTRVEQDAISLRVGGSVVNAIQSVQSVQQTVQATDNKRVQAMAAATAALAVKDAAAQAKDGLSVSLSLTAGHSESVQTTTISEMLHTGSALTAGRDISIVAKGGEGSGNINVIASDVNAGRNVTLAANNQVNMVAAQDLESQHSESKSISAEAGVAASYSTKDGMAVGLTASVSGSKGHDDGEGTTQVNTKVNAGQTLTIVSGGDTNIKGAVASGNQVVANVGGNLNLESLQDTAKFDSKTQSVSVSGTYGYGASVSGSASQTTIKSDYASVQEQSGIRAGDGGFQITVAGNTDLKGALISSTDAGTAANSLVTKTLTQNEIENHATMEGTSIGLSGGGTVGGTGDKGATGPGTIHWNDRGESGVAGGVSGLAATSSHDSSMTKSGISAGAITITDSVAQTALTGKSAEETVAGINRAVSTGVDTSGKIGNNSDLAEVKTTLDVTAQFAAAASNAVGTYASDKLKEAQQLYVEAASETDPDKAEEKIRQANQLASDWAEDGKARVALHTMVGGLAGNFNGALGAGAASVMTPLVAEQIRSLDIPRQVQSALILAAGTAVGAVAGGGGGAVAATNEVENNYLSHKEIALANKALGECAKKGGDVDACKKKIIEQMQELDAERDKDIGEATRIAQNAEYQIQKCDDRACVDGYQSKQLSAINYLSLVAAGKNNGTITFDGYHPDRLLELSLVTDGFVNAADKKLDRAILATKDGINYINKTTLSDWVKDGANGVWSGAKTAYAFGKAAITDPIPAFAVDRSIDNLSFKTTYDTGEIVFDAALGIVSYAGGKAATWIVGEGWKPLPSRSEKIVEVPANSVPPKGGVGGGGLGDDHQLLLSEHNWKKVQAS
ncbi:hemagglutinin repeat-containing protein [Massilia phyllosphaerae]|uniref:hemagglutinin repeat-containing protein n=1 Tax=Massilia phyllosphaerae TaxID=3106034 RepID=UPI002B1CDE09|nr:hemagglutinin repeat-containing protein [Massilia sp. SGZ-792]